MAKQPVQEVRLDVARDPRGNAEEISIFVDDGDDHLHLAKVIVVAPFDTDLDIITDLLRTLTRNRWRLV